MYAYQFFQILTGFCDVRSVVYYWIDFSDTEYRSLQKPVIKFCARLVQPSSNYRNKFLEPPFKIILTSTLKEVTEQIAISEFASGDTSLYFLFLPYKLHCPPTLYATPLLNLHIDKCSRVYFFFRINQNIYNIPIFRQKLNT